MKLLLVEDDPVLASGLEEALKREHFVVALACTGAQALAVYPSFEPDLVVLDLGLPDMDGTEVLRQLKKQSQLAPVLILTARDTIDDKVGTLDLGADDYLAKPFEIAELLARLRVLARRTGTATTSTITVGEVVLNTSSHELRVNGKVTTLQRREYRALRALLENVGRIQTKEMLERHLYDWGESIGSNTIEVHISNLRKKLPNNFIKTIRGIGYTIKPSNAD